jgi:hypothetical protein
MSWVGLSVSRQAEDFSIIARPIAKLMSPKAFGTILLTRCILASALVLSAVVPLHPNVIKCCAILLLVTTFLHHLRMPIGTDGSDHMNTIVLTTATITLFFNRPAVYTIGSTFIALQLILSYLVAGIAKAISKEWRSGQSTSGILSTWTYGFPPIGEFLASRARLTRFTDWCVIVFELSFPICLLWPGRGTLLFITLGILFHFSNALVMGLNTFFWAFASGYPPMLFLLSIMRKHSGQ